MPSECQEIRTLDTGASLIAASYPSFDARLCKLLGPDATDQPRSLAQQVRTIVDISYVPSRVMRWTGTDPDGEQHVDVEVPNRVTAGNNAVSLRDSLADLLVIPMARRIARNVPYAT